MIALESSVKKLNPPRKSKARVKNIAAESSDVEDDENVAEDDESVGEDDENVTEDDDNEDESVDDDDSDRSGDSGDAGSENSASEDEKPSSKSNPGWADVMQKILKTNKPKRKKSIVLSKAKKLTEVKAKEPVENVPFEIEAEDGARRKDPLPKSEKNKVDEEVAPKRRKKEVQTGIRVKPTIHDRERERMLQKIATKGVVQLFNVVKEQQMEINRKLVEVGPLERKREQVMKSIDKRAFLDVLMGGSKSIPIDDPSDCKKIEKKEEKTDKVWSVLRDDFVMGAKLKDWDKKAPEDEDDSTSSEEMDSD